MDFRKGTVAMIELFKSCEIEYTPDNEKQLFVFLGALKIYAERSKIYGDTWTTYGGLNNLLRAATKVDRTMEIWWHDSQDLDGSLNRPAMHKDNLDDAIDAINYLVFFIRCVRAGNITGGKRERPEAL